MNVEQAVGELKMWGLEIYHQENSTHFSGGSGISSDADPARKTSYYNPFSVSFDRGNHLWRLNIPFLDTFPIIKIASVLDNLVIAIKHFYTLSKQAHEEPLKICAAFIGLQKLCLMADIFDDDTIRLLIAPEPYRILGSTTRMMASLTMKAPEKEFFIRLEAHQWLIEEQLRVKDSQQGQFSTLKEVIDHIPMLYPELSKKRPMRPGKRLDKKLREAAASLREVGLIVQRQDHHYVLGAGSIIEDDDAKRFLEDPFALSFEKEDQLWVAQLTFAQVLPIIKVASNIEPPLLALKQFYMLCQHKHEDIKEAYTAFIRLQNLGLMADMFGDTIRVRIPPKPYRTLHNWMRMMASLTMDAPEKEFFIRREADQWLIEEQLRVKDSQMGRFLTLAEAVDHFKALYTNLRA